MQIALGILLVIGLAIGLILLAKAVNELYVRAPKPVVAAPPIPTIRLKYACELTGKDFEDACQANSVNVPAIRGWRATETLSA